MVASLPGLAALALLSDLSPENLRPRGVGLSVFLQLRRGRSPRNEDGVSWRGHVCSSSGSPPGRNTGVGEACLPTVMTAT